MFPIMNVQGKVVAFGGRRLDDNVKSAKYINSNENLVYSKKQHLYALNLAKLGDCKKIILVDNKYIEKYVHKIYKKNQGGKINVYF